MRTGGTDFVTINQNLSKKQGGVKWDAKEPTRRSNRSDVKRDNDQRTNRSDVKRDNDQRTNRSDVKRDNDQRTNRSDVKQDNGQRTNGRGDNGQRDEDRH
jgi:hypothetical protein